MQEALGKFKAQLAENTNINAQNKAEREELLQEMQRLRERVQAAEAASNRPQLVSHGNGEAETEKIAYWRKRYEQLLNKVSGIAKET